MENIKPQKEEEGFGAIITFRATKEEKKKLYEKAAACRISGSEYARKLINKEHPKAAINEEERALLLDIIQVKNALVLFANAIEGATKNMSPKERKNYILGNKSMQERAAVMDPVIDYLDKIIKKHERRKS